jgi:hypothetical protein
MGGPRPDTDARGQAVRHGRPLFFHHEPRADDQADIKALIEKAFKAHGGAEKINQYKGMIMKLKGKVRVMGSALDYTGDMLVQVPLTGPLRSAQRPS